MIIRSFVQYGNEQKTSGQVKDHDKRDDPPGKKVSKEVGEYIDYEELGKEE